MDTTTMTPRKRPFFMASQEAKPLDIDWLRLSGCSIIYDYNQEIKRNENSFGE